MHEIPQAKPTDAEDVAWGLQTAASLWNRGERSDAVAWLRRAAQAASDAEDDDRALELARIAAELADYVGTQGTMMPGAPPPPESVPVAVDESEESTAVNALPPSQDPPVSSHTPSVPPAEKVHAGMFDPWSEPPPPGAAPPPPPQVAAVPPPPIVNIPIPAAPITQPMFGEEEVVTSAKSAALPSKPAPPRPPPLPPGASRKPPPLPPRALAKKPASEPAQPAQPPQPALPLQAAQPAPDALPVSADLLAVTRPPPAPETAPLPIAEPRFPTPPPPSPTQQHAVFAGQEGGDERQEDEESSAETTPPPPVEASKPDAHDEPDDMAPTPIAPAVAARAARASEAPTEEPKPVPTDDRPKLDLENVDAFSDLPDDARAEFAAAGEVHVLAEGEETAGFALAYVMEGAFDVAATMVDAPAVRLAQGAVLRSRGTTNEGVPMRIIAASSPRSVVATWSGDAVETAFSNCPWVEEDLRAASDRVMTLVGITIGPLGERLDQSLREEIIGKLQVRPLIPGEIVVNKGEPVPGLVLVGVGELELVDGDDVKGIVGSGDFLFATEILGGGAAPYTARAGAGGALAMFGNRSVAQELMVTCPPLLEVFAGM